MVWGCGWRIRLFNSSLSYAQVSFNLQPFCILCCVLCWNETFLSFCPTAAQKTVLEVPVGSRFLRLSAKGPDVICECQHCSCMFDSLSWVNPCVATVYTNLDSRRLILVEKQNYNEQKQSDSVTIWPNRDRVFTAKVGVRGWQMSLVTSWLLYTRSGTHSCPQSAHHRFAITRPAAGERGWHWSIFPKCADTAYLIKQFTGTSSS